MAEVEAQGLWNSSCLPRSGARSKALWTLWLATERRQGVLSKLRHHANTE